VLAAVGAAVRLGGDTYPAAMAGQNLISIAQPLVLTAVTPLSVRYLAERDRPTGIALASAGTFAGMIAAFALGTLLDLRAVLIADTVLAVVAAVALVIALRERPAFIPSAPSGGMRDFLACWRDPLVRRTCLTVIIPFGTFTALTTWAQPLLGPAGIDADQAGILLMLNVTAGVIGCAVIPVWAARHGLRRRVLVTGILATVVGCIALSLVPSFIVGLVCFAVVGALLLSALPIVLEITERAMPRAAGAAAGLVWLAGQLGALVITGVIGELLGAPMVAFLVLGALTALALPVIPSRRAIGERPVPGVRASAAG
jgi:predicted MFS family arabinose efflux permease